MKAQSGDKKGRSHGGDLVDGTGGITDRDGADGKGDKGADRGLTRIDNTWRVRWSHSDECPR